MYKNNRTSLINIWIVFFFHIVNDFFFKGVVWFFEFQITLLVEIHIGRILYFKLQLSVWLQEKTNTEIILNNNLFINI